MIRFNAIIFAGWILTISCLAQESYEDVVYLKDGSIIRGMIIEQIPGKTIKIQTREQFLSDHRVWICRCGL